MSKKFVVVIGAIFLVLAGITLTGTQLAFSKSEDSHCDALDIAIAETLSMFRANDVDLRNARIANAEIWIKGNASEELTTVEKEIYAQMVYMLNEKYWVIGEQNKLLGLDQWKGLAAADFAGFLHEKPLAQRLWRERNDRLRHYRGIASPNEATTPAWRNSVESALAKFEQSTAGEE